MDIYIPSYLQTDYDEFIDSDLGQVCSLNYYTSPQSFRAIITDKRDGNGNIRDLRCSKSFSIKKGDTVTDASSVLYLIIETPFTDLNCIKSTIHICTNTISFERYANSTLDSSGVVTGGISGYSSVASSTRGYFQNSSAGSYSASVGMVGVTQSQKVMYITQYNSSTQNIRISDEFSYKSTQYVISDIDNTQLNSTGTSGLLVVYAQVLEGGRRS